MCLYCPWKKRTNFNYINNCLENYLWNQVTITIAWIIPLWLIYVIISWHMVPTIASNYVGHVFIPSGKDVWKPSPGNFWKECLGKCQPKIGCQGRCRKNVLWVLCPFLLPQGLGTGSTPFSTFLSTHTVGRAVAEALFLALFQVRASALLWMADRSTTEIVTIVHPRGFVPDFGATSLILLGSSAKGVFAESFAEILRKLSRNLQHSGFLRRERVRKFCGKFVELY